VSWQGWVTLAVTIVIFVLLVRDVVTPWVSMIGGVVTLLVLGILTPAEAFGGFSNPAPITVAALYIIARAVEKTGGLQPIVASALGGGKGNRRSLLRLIMPASAASAFLNNTPIVSMLIGPVTEWAERNGKSPSRYLMPLAFAVSLGGVVTAIGTSTNLVVSGLLEQMGQPPLRLFELTPIGLPLALLGVLLIVWLAPIVLPERRSPRDALQEGVREFVVELIVERNGPLVGRPVEGGGLRHLRGVYLVQIERGNETIAPVDPTTELRGDDRLTFVGRADVILDLQAMRGLRPVEQPHIDAFDTDRHTFFEVVVGDASPLVGKTLKEVQFRSRYQAAVVAIHRSGHRVKEKLGAVNLRLGDTLLLLSDAGFRDRWRDRHDFLVVSRVGGTAPAVTRKAPLVGVVTFAVVVVAGAGLLPILQAALLGAAALVLLRVLTAGEARAAVDLDVLMLIAASFGLGLALEKTGVATLLAEGLVRAFSDFGRVGPLLGVVIATMVVTELVTNNAAAVMLFPIGIAVATRLGVDPRPYAIAVAIAASASFITPIGYQTNTMVYGPGGYRFSDYVRLGLPLSLLTIVVIAIAVKLLWGI
jgi:di/tricarboxylate transporter